MRHDARPRLRPRAGGRARAASRSRSWRGSSVTVAPVDPETAAELVAEAGIDDPHGVVAPTLAALGRLALAHPEIESIDVNPLIVGAGGTVAVDALVVVA